MIRRFRRTAATVTAVILLGGASLGCASETEKTPEDRMVELVDQRVEQALDDIAASDQQRKRVHAIKDELVDEFKRVHAEHEGTRQVVEELWLQDEPDKKKAHELVDKRFDEMRATAHRVTDAAFELHDVLTPEQRRKLADQVKERRRCWHDRFHRAGDGQ